MAGILCFGDSITQGYTDKLGGWTQRLRSYLDSKYVTKYTNDILVPSHGVFNLGISGDTSHGLLERFEAETERRLLDKDVILIIAIGTNDSVYREKNGAVDCDEATFEQNIQALITKAKKYTDKIIIVGLMPCQEEIMQPMPWSTSGKSYSNQRLKLFNEVLSKTAKHEDVSFIDVFDAVLTKGPKQYLADGLHPNETGHILLASEIQSVVEHFL